MKKFFLVTAMIGAIILFVNNIALADEDPTEGGKWYYLFADDKYAKYFAPSTVKVMKKAVTEDGREVPTEIEGWTKTTYTYEGAESTINAYGISNTLSDPNELAYSLALIKINPQTRTVQYAKEEFYNKKNEVIWAATEGRVKEINSRSFDEDFYVAIVDQIFRHGEGDRKRAKNRWIDLWSSTNDNGETIKVTADTTTMQLKGINLILWEWEETKNADGQAIKIRFLKKAVNLPQGTERIAAGSVWTAEQNKWSDLKDDGTYHSINEDDPDFKGLVRLRAYAQGYSTWVTRYSITSNATTVETSTDSSSEKKPEPPAPSNSSQEKTRD